MVGIKSSGNREDTKNAVFEYVKKKVDGQVKWPLKRNQSSFSDECYDMADAYVIARAGVTEDCVQRILNDLHVNEALRGEMALSPFFSEFCKISVAYHLRKHADEQIDSLDDLPKEVVLLPFSHSQMYYTKLRDLVEEAVSKSFQEYCLEAWSQE